MINDSDGTHVPRFDTYSRLQAHNIHQGDHTHTAVLYFLITFQLFEDLDYKSGKFEIRTFNVYKMDFDLYLDCI